MQAPDHEYSGAETVVAPVSLEGVDWTRLVFEASVLDRLLQTKRKKADVDVAMEALGWSRAKLYRKIKRYIAAGHVLALTRLRRAPFSAKSRLSPEQDKVIEATLKAFLRKCAGFPISDFVKKVQTACKEQQVPSPSARSISRRFDRLSGRIKFSHKFGSEKAAEKYNLHKGKTPECSFPLQRVQIDHTDGDVWVVSEDRKMALGRPTVSFAIDEFSRLVLAIHITFGFPSINELAEVCAIAFLPKDGWLRSLGFEGVEWPWFGIPGMIFVDCGVDFTSNQFKWACGKWRIQLAYRPQPHYGGEIERLIGTAMQRTRLLPGNTRRSKMNRKRDKVDPSKTAQLTLSEYMAELVNFFVREYPYQHHSGIGMNPAEKWNLGIHQYGETKRASDPEQFYLDFLRGDSRTIQKYGIGISYLTYTDPDLQPIINAAKSASVQVKRDPADVSRAFVENPLHTGYIEVTNYLTKGRNITVSEWEAAKAELKRQRRGKAGILTPELILSRVRKGGAQSYASLIADAVYRPTKLVRKKMRAAAHDNEKRVRSATRLRPPKEPAAQIKAAAPAIDPSVLRLYD